MSNVHRLRPQGSTTLKSASLNLSSWQSLPVQVQLLLLIQKGCSWFSGGLILATITIYGLTVCLPKIWDHDYRRLRELQRQERDLTMVNEKLKSKLLEQTEKDNSSLSYPTPENTIFLTPDSSPPPPPQTKSESPTPSLLLSKDRPVAY